MGRRKGHRWGAGMTSFTVKAQVTSAGIEPLDRDRLARYKEALKPGEFVRITFEPWEDKRSGEAFRLFHAYMNRYAAAQGYNQYDAKEELKRLFGVTIRIIDVAAFIINPPKRSGRFVELHSEIHFHISTKEYTKSEMSRLLDGTIQACYDVGADIEGMEVER